MALLGYARVSTSHQKLTLQMAELKREDRIFTDMMTGATDGRIAAMASGVRFGRKKHPATASALSRQGMSFKAVSEKTGISRPTYFRLKKWSSKN